MQRPSSKASSAADHAIPVLLSDLLTSAELAMRHVTPLLPYVTWRPLCVASGFFSPWPCLLWDS
jgi:hypothetical protein